MTAKMKKEHKWEIQECGVKDIMQVDMGIRFDVFGNEGYKTDVLFHSVSFLLVLLHPFGASSAHRPSEFYSERRWGSVEEKEIIVGLYRNTGRNIHARSGIRTLVILFRQTWICWIIKRRGHRDRRNYIFDKYVPLWPVCHQPTYY